MYLSASSMKAGSLEGSGSSTAALMLLIVAVDSAGLAEARIVNQVSYHPLRIFAAVDED